MDVGDLSSLVGNALIRGGSGSRVPLRIRCPPFFSPAAHHHKSLSLMKKQIFVGCFSV
jgi:hypothetical protein